MLHSAGFERVFVLLHVQWHMCHLQSFFLLFDRFKFGKLPQPLCCISVDTDVDI